MVTRKTVLLFVSALMLAASCAAPRYQMTPEAQTIMGTLHQITAGKQLSLMEGTPHQTPAFIFEGEKPGVHMMIVGGTHGNEPAGYEAALRLVNRFQNMPPLTGRVILVPLANRVAIDQFDRRVPMPKGENRERGNLNRCYPGDPDGLPMEQLAYQIQQLAIANQVGIFIDLHEALIPHLETDTESEERGLGQTIIYHPNEPSTWLLMELLDTINEWITEPAHRFTPLEQPIKNSAAWWAGNYLDCAAFTFETSRSLPLQTRIAHHLKLVDIVLGKRGMAAEDSP